MSGDLPGAAGAPSTLGPPPVYAGVAAKEELPAAGPAAQRNSVVAWSPDVATRVIVASEDDRNPVLQVWDLRNATAPQIEMRGHHKGILSASWCPFDSNLLISSGKVRSKGLVSSVPAGSLPFEGVLSFSGEQSFHPS